MQKPMNPSEEKKHMKQISIPLFSPAIAPERARSRRSRLRGFVMCFVIRSVTLWSPSCWRLSFRAHLGVGSMGVPPGELASKRQGAAGQPQRPGFRAQPFLSHPPPLRRDRGHKRDVAARNDSANH